MTVAKTDNAFTIGVTQHRYIGFYNLNKFGQFMISKRRFPSRFDAIRNCSLPIVRTNGSDEVLARAINLQIGRSAYETAKRMFPKDVIEHRRDAQIVERSGAANA